MKKTILYIIVLFGISCQQEQIDGSVMEYFDSSVFVDAEINRLLSKNFIAEKEIILNGEREFLTVEKLDTAFLKNEFKLLKAGNINKPALLGFYSEDTVGLIFYPEAQIKNLKSTAFLLKTEKETKFKTKEMLVVSDRLKNNKIEKVSLVLANENFMHAYRKEINYISEKEMKVKAWEKTLFQDTLFYETKLSFIKN